MKAVRSHRRGKAKVMLRTMKGEIRSRIKCRKGERKEEMKDQEREQVIVQEYCLLRFDALHRDRN
jgi:hypothetical protein